MCSQDPQVAPLPVIHTLPGVGYWGNLDAVAYPFLTQLARKILATLGPSFSQALYYVLQASVLVGVREPALGALLRGGVPLLPRHVHHAVCRQRGRRKVARIPPRDDIASCNYEYTEIG